MEAILRTNNYDDNYEIVEVVKNPIAKNNGLAHIIDGNGEEKWTGGILIKKDLTTMKVLDSLSPLEQWEWLRGIRTDCYVR